MANEPNYKAELIGCFGYPVAENPTGLMQEAAFKALGLNWRYLLFEVPKGGLAEAVKAMRVLNFQGFNCTIPHKVDVIEFLDDVSPDARLMGAVNTVHRAGERLIGENTDGKGFLRSLSDDANVDPRGKRAVILGAGGAARAMSVELALAGAAQITIVNRNEARGAGLAAMLAEKTRTPVEFVPWRKKFGVPGNTDILVNATSIGLFPKVDEKPDLDYDTIRGSMLVCDVIPNPPRTPFLRKAEKRGATTLDGLGMLVYQGAIALNMWTGRDAPIKEMRKALALAFEK